MARDIDECKKCGSWTTEKRNIQYLDRVDNSVPAEYDVHCKECGEHMYFFSYGSRSE